MGITGCINITGFNNLSPGVSIYPIIEDGDSISIQDQDIITSKVILNPNGGGKPVDIENINLLIIQELNARSIQINIESVKNDKINEQPQNNEVIPVVVEDDPPPPVEIPNSSSLEIQIFNMLNHIRVQNGLQKLNLNPVVSNVAKIRSTDMIKRNYFSHYTPEGKHTKDILRENGVMYSSSGEILFRSSPPSAGSPGVVINTWMGSSIHRALILTHHFTQVGIGIVDGGNKRVVSVIFLN